MCYRDLLAGEHSNRTDPGLETQKTRFLLFQRIGETRLRGSDEEWKNITLVLKKHARCETHSDSASRETLNSHVQSEGQYDGGMFIGNHPTTSPHVNSTSSAIGNPSEASTDVIPRALSSAIIPDVNINLPHEQTNQAVQSDRQMEIWHYTSELKMHGDRQTIVPKYDTKQLSDQPPVFISTVWFGDLVVSGDKDSTKKGAKHMASKAAWLELGLPPLKA
jgi:hypothetical protein